MKSSNFYAENNYSLRLNRNLCVYVNQLLTHIMTASVVKSVSVNNHVSVANFAFCITHCLCGYVNKFLIQIISVSVCNSVSVGNHVSVVNSVSISSSVCA